MNTSIYLTELDKIAGEWPTTHSWLSKSASTRALREVRKAFAEGGKSKADEVAERIMARGGMKRSVAGSQVKALGSGAEGTAVVTVGQGRNAGRTTVRKSFDPESYLASNAMIDRKMEVLNRPTRGFFGGKKPERDIAKFHGEIRQGGTRHHFNELVEGKDPAKVMGERVQNIMAAQERGSVGGALRGLKSVLRQNSALSRIQNSDPRYQLTDVMTNPGNYKLTDKGPKAIDFLPLRRREILRQAANAPKDFSAGGIRSMWEKAGVPVNPAGRLDVSDPRRALGALGPGSRQAKKIRGAKPPGKS